MSFSAGQLVSLTRPFYGLAAGTVLKVEYVCPRHSYGVDAARVCRVDGGEIPDFWGKAHPSYVIAHEILVPLEGSSDEQA